MNYWNINDDILVSVRISDLTDYILALVPQNASVRHGLTCLKCCNPFFIYQIDALRVTDVKRTDQGLFGMS